MHSYVKIGVLGIVAALAAGCSSDKAPKLMYLKSASSSPDEFAILPSKPLEEPEDYAALPTPTPGGSNVTDPTPKEDAVAALGGKTRKGKGVPRSDGALVNHARSKAGASGDIRTVLADEDLEYRKKNNGRFFERLFKVNAYYNAYDKQSLDKYQELDRMRNAGAKTVAAPEPAVE
ncbi:MAG: DUF3035 domain-containing protein [Halocynthiibacter sp.]